MHTSKKAFLKMIAWSAFFNGLLACIISVWNIPNVNFHDSFFVVTYFALQQLGHFQFFAFLLAAPILIIALLIPRKRLIQTLLVIVFGFYIAFIIVDYAVFKLYHFHLNGMVWNMLTGGAVKEIFAFDFVNILTLLFYIAIIVSLQIGLQYYLTKRRASPPLVSGYVIAASVVSIMLCGQAIYVWADAWYKPEYIAQTQLIPFPQPLTMKRFLHKRGWSPNIPERQKQLSAVSKGRFNYPSEKLSCKAADHSYNLLFIVADSLRYDMLNPDTMPNWHTLSEQSLVFEHHVSTGNATRFGVYGLFSGLYGHYWFDSLANTTGSVLINELKSNQYNFGFFPSARLTSPEFHRTVFSQVREYIPEKTQGDDVVSRDQEITRQALKFIDTASEQPFFALVFYDAPHAYAYPEQDAVYQPALDSINYLDLNNDSDPLPFLNRYKNAAHFVDRLTGKIIDSLKENNLLDKTIVVLTSDHGQEINDTKNNRWGHGSNFSKYQIQVPLSIYWPGRDAQRFTHLSSHVDVVPTLLEELFQCENPISSYSNGQSLFDQTEREFVLVKDWNNQAIVSKSQVQVFSNIGFSESYQYDSYAQAQQETEQNGMQLQVIHALSQYYK